MVFWRKLYGGIRLSLEWYSVFISVPFRMNLRSLLIDSLIWPIVSTWIVLVCFCDSNSCIGLVSSSGFLTDNPTGSPLYPFRWSFLLKKSFPNCISIFSWKYKIHPIILTLKCWTGCKYIPSCSSLNSSFVFWRIFWIFISRSSLMLVHVVSPCFSYFTL